MADQAAKSDSKSQDRKDEENLEKGLEETFPASDPPANVQPGHNDPAPSSGYDETEEEVRKHNP